MALAPAGPSGPTGWNEIVEFRDEIAQEFKSLRTLFQSSVGETVGAVLAINRGASNAAVPSDHLKRDRFVPHPSLIKMLRDFLGDPYATFKTPEQAEALEVSLVGNGHLMLVGPTAMGKSLVYMLPAKIRDHSVTCVLLPLSALHLDFERRCRDLKIESSQWLPGINENPRTRIVYVSPEHGMTSKFVDYLLALSRKGELTQFVIDEVHLVHQHSKFRFCFTALKPLVLSSGLFSYFFKANFTQMILTSVQVSHS